MIYIEISTILECTKNIQSIEITIPLLKKIEITIIYEYSNYAKDSFNLIDTSPYKVLRSLKVKGEG